METERKYDHSQTGTYSIDDILSELEGKKPEQKKEISDLPKKEAAKPIQTEESSESGHELWIGLGADDAEEDRFDTNEYEPEDFKELNKPVDEEDISKTTVCELPDIKKKQIIALDLISNQELEDEAVEGDPEDRRASQKKAHILRLCFGSIPTVLLVFIGIARLNGLELISFLESGSWLFPTVTGGLLLIAVLIYILPVLRGFKALFAGAPSGDSGIMLAAVTALMLPVAAIFYPEMASTLPVFGASAAIGLLLSSVGGLLSAGSRRYALEYARTEGEKRVLIPVQSEQSCKDLLSGMRSVGREVYEPVRTEEVSELDETLYSCGLSDMSLRVMTLISLFGGIGVAAADYFLFGKSIPTALTAFVCFVSASTALTAPLISTLPLYRAARHLSRFGSAITGCDAVSEMTQIGSVVVDSNYLFPKNSVVLHGIRTFGSFRIDDAIIDAASVVCASGGALSGVFLGVIDNDRSLLRKVDTILYEDGLGLSAWVSERRVLIGAADLLKNHGVDVPSRDYEEKYRQNGRDLVYVSVAGQLTAMFVVSYRVRREIYEEVRRLYRHKVGLIILNRDCNITEEKISRFFRYPENMIKILPPASEHVLGKPDHKECPARIIYSKGIMGLIETVVTALRMSTTVNITNILQLGGSILGCALIAYLTVIKGLAFFGLGELLLWQGIWGALTLVVSFFRKP